MSGNAWVAFNSKENQQHLEPTSFHSDDIPCKWKLVYNE